MLQLSYHLAILRVLVDKLENGVSIREVLFLIFHLVNHNLFVELLLDIGAIFEETEPGNHVVHKLFIIIHTVQVPIHVEECLSVGILRHVVHWVF